MNRSGSSEKKDLYRRIDEALERGDEKEFLQLTEQWLKFVEKES